MQNKQFGKNLSKGISRKLNSIFSNKYEKANLNWFTIKYYKHLPPGKVRIHRLCGKKLYFYSAQQFLATLIEIFVDEVYKQQILPNSRVIDCGSNIGLGIIYIKQLCPTARITAFEPDDINFDLLTKNLSSFGYTDVDLHKEAVWIENTSLQFSNEGSTDSRIVTGNSANAKMVKASRLKDFLNERIDFLKIDVEGAEFAILNDIAECLNNVKTLFIEYHGLFNQDAELVQLLQLITKYGFHFYIGEAASVYATPFSRDSDPSRLFDIQLNIFCFRT